MSISSRSKKFLWSAAILLAIIIIGTVGYWILGGRQYSLMDTLYMTVITISTIGFGEVIDLAGIAGGRVFTIFIAISGIGVLLYVVTNLTALIIEGELTESFKRRKIEKMASNAKKHYIVCGLGLVGSHIVKELHETKRPYIVVDINKDIDKSLEALPDKIFIEGDATDNNILARAGIERARGLFAVTGDDNQNLVVCLTAKQLNHNLRVVARCSEVKNVEKMYRAGADAVVSPSFIGGLRIVSEMIRPTVVSFLDIMLQDKDKNLRVEEMPVPDALVGKTVSTLNLKKQRNILLLAIKTGEDWIYNPSDDHVLEPYNTLIVMTTPEEREKLEGAIRADGITFS